MISEFLKKIRRNKYAYDLLVAWAEVQEDMEDALDEDNLVLYERLARELELLERDMFVFAESELYGL